MVPYSTGQDQTWNAFRGSGKVCLPLLVSLPLVIEAYTSYVRTNTFQFLIKNVSDLMREGRDHRERKWRRHRYRLSGTYWICFVILLKKCSSLSWRLGMSWRQTLHTGRFLLTLTLILILKIEVQQIWSKSVNPFES